MTWVSGSPKRQLNSSTRGPVGGEHQAGIQHADKGRAFGAQAVDSRLQDTVTGKLSHHLGRADGAGA